MQKTLIVYYSNTGNNKFLAHKMAASLGCDIEEIKPRMKGFFFQMILSSMKRSLGIRSLKHDVSTYSNVVLFGPVWMGKLLSPLRSFINNYGNKIQHLSFATCCGTSEEVKDDQFGHGHVFREIQAIMHNDTLPCNAFPIGLILPEDKQKDGDAIMKMRLNDGNFTGELKKRFDKFVDSFK